jgi:membrane protein involved in colicin uptake
MNVLDKLPDAYQCEAFNKLKQVADISAMTAEEFADYEWSRRHYYDWETTKYFMEKEKEEAEKAKEEAKQAKEEAKQAKEEAKQAKEESKQAKEESKQAKEESKQAKEESKQAKEETKQAKEESKQAKEAKLNMARYMKSHGTPIEEIKALSNLTEEEINAL